jgi:hypothetical protein
MKLSSELHSGWEVAQAENLPARSYAEPAQGYYILNPSELEAVVANPHLICIVDMQAELGAYDCKESIYAIRQSLRKQPAGQVILFVLWPGAGPVIPELAFAAGVQSVAVQKERDGGEEMFRFWEDQGRPKNIQMMGINLNVCVYNAVAEFLSCCEAAEAVPPLIHFQKSTLADTNYLDDPGFGWDHFRHVISSYCRHQKPPEDTEYVAADQTPEMV